MRSTVPQIPRSTAIVHPDAERAHDMGRSEYRRRAVEQVVAAALHEIKSGRPVYLYRRKRRRFAEDVDDVRRWQAEMLDAGGL